MSLEQIIYFAKTEELSINGFIFIETNESCVTWVNDEQRWMVVGSVFSNRPDPEAENTMKLNNITSMHVTRTFLGDGRGRL